MCISLWNKDSPEPSLSYILKAHLNWRFQYHDGMGWIGMTGWGCTCNESTTRNKRGHFYQHGIYLQKTTLKEKNLFFYRTLLWSISGHHELLEINAPVPITVKNVENLQQNYSSVTKNRDLIRTIFHSIGTFDQHIWYWIKGRNGKSGYLVDKFWCLWSGQDHGIETGHLSLMVRNFFV